MILSLVTIKEEDYNKVKEQFYKKPNIPEIELQLETYQKELLIHNNYKILPEFIKTLAIYSKSLLLKQLKGSSDFIEEDDVEVLTNTIANNFIKRYFRSEDSIVGASFAGILIFKVKEVLSYYFKNKGLESSVSIDDDAFKDNESHVTKLEEVLSYKKFEKENKDEDLMFYKENILRKIDREVSLLKRVSSTSKIHLLFLQYLIYLFITQKEKQNKKLDLISSQVLKFLNYDKTENPERIASLLESALLDIQTN